MFYCDGYAYENIYIIPSKRLVVVRLGLTLDHSFDENAFLKSIIESINDQVNASFTSIELQFKSVCNLIYL